ncbi:MAG TPA: ABC transporter permease [Myxococcales bacterium]|nr:ABC transporter permease [Myxococcales bacterium]
MKLHRVAAIVMRQLYLLRGSPARVLPLFAWVAVDVVLWGFITRFLDRVSGAGFDFVPMLLGAVLLWDYLARVMQGVTMAFFEDVWTRNFLNFFATPLTIAEYVSGLVATSIMTSVVGLLVMVLVARAAFGLSLLAYGPPLAGFLAVLFVFGITLGVLGTAIVLRLGPAAEWLIWPIPALLSPFAGVFYPLSTLPSWMRAVSRALPPSYVFEALREIAAGRMPAPQGLLAGGGLAVAELALAAWVFARVYRHAVRTGLLARYSAETVS